MWLTEQLSRLDQFFMSLGGNRLAFLAALVVLVASTVALDRLTPLKEIKKRLGDKTYISTGMTFGYRPADLYAMLDAYRDESDRVKDDAKEFDYYKAHRFFIALDMIYPLLYSVSLAVMLGCLLPYAAPHEHAKIHYLTLVPLLAAVFDYLENLSLLAVINGHEADHTARHNGLAAFSSAMTTAKLALLYATLFVVVVGLIQLAVSFIPRATKPAAP